MEIKSKEIKMVGLETIVPNPKNPNSHSKEQIDRLCKLIKNTGFRNPLVVSNQSGFLVVGHGRLEVAKKLKMKEVPVIFQDFKNEADEYAYMTADNAIASWSELDLEKIKIETLEFENFDLEMLGLKEFVLEQAEKDSEYLDTGISGSLAKNFIAPPFSVLDCKQGYWKERKKFWLGLGIKSEVGRGKTMESMSSARKAQTGKSEVEEWVSSSIFDPVLCELMYSWFSKKDGIIIDPFSGGSVRGIVASKIGRKYIGIDLRQEQIDANNSQLDLCGDGPAPTWICNDSMNIDSLLKDIKGDMVFSCPPYADLEVYSDDPKDISTMPYDDFKKVYSEIIKKTCSLLNDDSFAVFIVGEVRGKDKNGSYYNFVGDTIKAFEDAGLKYYNEIILVTPVGTLALRAGKTFRASRKIGKGHQNALVFLKGNARKATEKIGIVEVMEIEDDHTYE